MTLRLKLTAAFVAVILVANSLLSLVAVEYLESAWLGEVRTRVGLDLHTARTVYDGYLERWPRSCGRPASTRNGRRHWSTTTGRRRAP